MEIFADKRDYDRFQKLLYATNSKETIKFSDMETGKSPSRAWTFDRGETLVDIGSYKLMPNHFHILIRSKSEKDTSAFLHRLLTSHSRYFNTKYERTGSLFQGKSKSEHVKGDKYLRYLFTYIHLNIIKLLQNDWKEVGLKNPHQVKEYLKNYKYSSFLDYSGVERPEGKIVNKEAFPGYFHTPELFEKEIESFLSYGKDDASKQVQAGLGQK